LDEIIEDTRGTYYLALHYTQNNHKSDHEDIAPWLNYLLDSLVTHADKARTLMVGEQPEKFLAQNQEEILAVFGTDDILGISEIIRKLGGKPRDTVKKNLARLVALKLLEIVGQGRGSRYKKTSH
jgi:Fic family protein